jgi:hypothetical protein
MSLAFVQGNNSSHSKKFPLVNAALNFVSGDVTPLISLPCKKSLPMEIQTAARDARWVQYEGQDVANDLGWRAGRANPPAQKRGVAQIVIG